MSDIETDLAIFIKNTLLKLACCNNIDHRNYDNKNKQFYRLKELAMYNSIENSIVIIIKDILNNNILKEGWDESDEDDEIDKDDEENEDERYEKNNNIFTNFIDYVGLFEIYNLHADNCDNFKDEFLQIIKKHNL